MTKYETHVFASVRIKVLGTNFSTDPQEIAEKVTEAVCSNPDQWLSPVHGTVHIDGHGAHDIEIVEFAQGISGVLVDEIDPESGAIRAEHDFDESCGKRVADNTTETLAEVLAALASHPESKVGNSKVHFAVMRLKGLLANR